MADSNRSGSTAVPTVIAGYMELDGKRLPISKISASFGINSIPSAQVVIPVGRAVSGDADETVRVRDVTDAMRQYTPATVWLQLSGEFAPGIAWPAEAFQVFSGYVSGTSSTRTTEGLGLIVNLVHWLIDMDASSASSDFLVPGSPVGVQLPTNADYSTVSSAMSDRAMSDSGTDVWQGAIKPKMVQLCSEVRLTSVVQCLRDVIGDIGTELSNRKAERRLVGTVDAFDVSDKIDNVPLLISDQDETADNLAFAIKVNIIGVMSDAASVSGSSMWSKLLSLANVFGYTIVPTVNSATCAPLSYVLAGDDPARHVTIHANEYSSVTPSDGLFRMWRAMIVTGEFATAYRSVEAEPDDSTTFIGAVGCYFPELDEELPDSIRKTTANGTIQFMPIPPWVQPEFRAVLEAAFRAERNLQQQNHTMSGPPAAAAPQAPAEENRINDITTNSKTMGSNFAKWLYWVNQFRGSTAQLEGKLRFDIAPGSIIRIEDLDGKLYESDADRSWLYATVTGVSFYVDTDSVTAGTSFSLSHLRRHNERLNGTDGHPLYTRPWIGTVLQNLEYGSGQASAFIPKVGTHERQ